jgi:hypothetical protein
MTHNDNLKALSGQYYELTLKSFPYRFMAGLWALRLSGRDRSRGRPMGRVHPLFF